MAKIAYFFSTFPALSTTFVQHQVAATQRLGLDAVLISTRPPAPDGYHPQDDHFYRKTCYLSRLSLKRYVISNIKALCTSPLRYLKGCLLALRLTDDFPWQRLKNLMHLIGAAVLTDILRKNDVIHLHVHFAFGAASIAIFTGILANTTYSMTIHGSDVLLKRPLTEEKLKRAEFIISNCRFHIENLKNRYPALKHQRFYVVRGGLCTTSGPWALPAPIDRTPPLRILHVARLEPVKAQGILIRACAVLKADAISFRLKIAGDGPMRKELEALVKELELSEYVELLGRCYQDQVIELYEWSQVVVLSSLSEGTPMTVIEAMAKGRPVVVPDITALPEMVVQGESGFLFPAGSHQDLAEYLKQMAESPDLPGRMGQHARKHAEKLFDLDQNAKQLIAIFGNELTNVNVPIHEDRNYEK